MQNSGARKIFFTGHSMEAGHSMEVLERATGSRRGAIYIRTPVRVHTGTGSRQCRIPRNTRLWQERKAMFKSLDRLFSDCQTSRRGRTTPPPTTTAALASVSASDMLYICM